MEDIKITPSEKESTYDNTYFINTTSNKDLYFIYSCLEDFQKNLYKVVSQTGLKHKIQCYMYWNTFSKFEKDFFEQLEDPSDSLKELFTKNIVDFIGPNGNSISIYKIEDRQNLRKDVDETIKRTRILKHHLVNSLFPIRDCTYPQTITIEE